MGDTRDGLAGELIQSFLRFIIDCQPYTRLPTNRAFPVAAARVWNSLPALCHFRTFRIAVFRSRLKTHLFNISYPCDCTVPAQLLWTL